MNIAFLSAALLVVLPLMWATWIGWPVHRLLAMTAVTIVLAGGLLAAYTSTPILLSQTHESAFHDTYYVVAQGYWISTSAAVFALLLLLNWAAYHYARPVGRHLSIIAVWCLALGLLAPSFLSATVLSPPRRYVDYPAWMHTQSTIEQMGNLAAGASLLVLIMIPIHALILRRV